MSVFEYFKASDLMQRTDVTRDWETVIGRKGADAERVGLNNSARITRTRAGYAQAPTHTHTARYGMGKYAKTITGVEPTRDTDPDADQGMVTVRFEDGTAEHVGPKDLFCVEFEIGK